MRTAAGCRAKGAQPGISHTPMLLYLGQLEGAQPHLRKDCTSPAMSSSAPPPNCSHAAPPPNMPPPPPQGRQRRPATLLRSDVIPGTQSAFVSPLLYRPTSHTAHAQAPGHCQDRPVASIRHRSSLLNSIYGRHFPFQALEGAAHTPLHRAPCSHRT